MFIKKGLDIPIAGVPNNDIDTSLSTAECAVLGTDFVGFKPKILTEVGNKVKIGTPLFYDKRDVAVKTTSPCSGEVIAINRGYRRALRSIVIANDKLNTSIDLPHSPPLTNDQVSVTTIKELLAESGQWMSFRTRPFSQTPPLDSVPNSIFVTAIDTNPLCLDPKQIIDLHKRELTKGLEVLSLLASKVHVCTDPETHINVAANNVLQHHFSGVHPAGLVGTHIHYIDPITSGEKIVWTINYQDVIAIGHLFLHKKIWTQRYITLAGPRIINPRILKINLGSNLQELTQNEISMNEDGTENKPYRIISGSILNGHHADNDLQYLGRYHLQTTVLDEGLERPFLHYVRTGVDRFSKIPIYISKLLPPKRWNFSTTTNGSDRAMVPIGVYEEIMPLDLLPTQLLRALIVGDSEMAQHLGCLELDEEDLALCTYVCPGKYDYGPILRNNLQYIQKQG